MAVTYGVKNTFVEVPRARTESGYIPGNQRRQTDPADAYFRPESEPRVVPVPVDGRRLSGAVAGLSGGDLPSRQVVPAASTKPQSATLLSSPSLALPLTALRRRLVSEDQQGPMPPRLSFDVPPTPDNYADYFSTTRSAAPNFITYLNPPESARYSSWSSSGPQQVPYDASSQPIGTPLQVLATYSPLMDPGGMTHNRIANNGCLAIVQSISPPQMSQLSGCGTQFMAASMGGAEEHGMTVMLRNIPVRYNRETMLADMEARGFSGSYDFFYLPIDFQTGNTVGYAFVNFVSAADADRFRSVYQGLQLSPESIKICEVVLAKAQGKAKNVEQYRNSSVMSMEERFKPLVFENGVRVPFPPPTRNLKPVKPRVKA